MRPIESESIREMRFSQLEGPQTTAHRDHEIVARTAFERDRDRVIYTSAFRRLNRVTQVVHAQEGDIYHNRLTHTLEVAQIGRRLSQYLIKYGERKSLDGLSSQLNPDVVEAACLIHDLGHPPFGHVAEHKLDEMVTKNGDPDGYEGNAQSFRIVTRLINYNVHNGLDLTRATLNAVLKYPWLRSGEIGSKKHRKFNAYEDDREIFDFAREGFQGDALSIEAQVMDLADGIAYAVHDLNDFYKAGLLDLSFVNTDRKFDKYFEEFIENHSEAGEHKDYIRDICNAMPSGKFTGSRDDEISQVTMSSNLIARLLEDSIGIREDKGLFYLDPLPRVEILIGFLKSILWRDVIMRPSLALQQAGQERIIEKVFEYYMHSFEREDGYRHIPSAFSSEDNIRIVKAREDKKKIVRLVSDIVASMSETQIKLVYSKIMGHNSGSIMDVR